MAEAARKSIVKGMTVAEFLSWNDGTDARYELLDGVPSAMAPTLLAHAAIVSALGAALNARLKAPCQAFHEVGIAFPDRDDQFYVADVAIACGAWRPSDRYLPNPVVLIEVLSPSTAAHDRGTKAAEYRTLPSAQEIVLLATTAVRAEIWRRTGEGWLIEDVIGADAVLHLRTVDVELPLRLIYERIPLDVQPTGQPASA